MAEWRDALGVPRPSASSAHGSRSNAFRPSSRWQLLGVSFFAAWLTGELAIWTIVLQAIGTVVFVALGALDAWPGWVGLGDHDRLVGRAARPRRDRPAAPASVFDTALTDGIGLDPPDQLRRGAARTQSVFPFLLHDRRVERIKNLEYGAVRASATARRLPAARPPSRSTAPAPVLLQIHGGAWVIGDKSQQGLPLMLHLAAEGWVCVAINYRLSPKATWPEHLIDCKRALAWVREHIAEYGGDPDLICVTGGSAGGHLAAMVGAHRERAGVPARLRGRRHARRRVRAVLRHLRLRRALRGRRDDRPGACACWPGGS